MKGYTFEEYSLDIDAQEYIGCFMDPERIHALCAACPNYGKSWACPPFESGADRRLGEFRRVRLTAVKIFPEPKDISLERFERLLIPFRLELERRLLELERILKGMAFTNVGKCPHCGDMPCSRETNEACRHPEKVRPSLEAFGFDVEKTLREIFDIRIKWGKDGLVPEYLMIVTGVFHNSCVDENSPLPYE